MSEYVTIVDGKEVLVERGRQKFSGKWAIDQCTIGDNSLRTGYYQTAIDGPAPRFLDTNKDAPVPGCTITGSTGSGKSNQLANLLIQEAYNGNGFCLIDKAPWETALSLLEGIPNNRVRDVIWIDVTAAGHANNRVGIGKDQIVPFNPISIQSIRQNLEFSNAISNDISHIITSILLNKKTPKGGCFGMENLISSLIKSELEYDLMDLYEVIIGSVDGRELADSDPYISKNMLDSVWNGEIDWGLHAHRITELLLGNVDSILSKENNSIDIPSAIENDNIIVFLGSDSTQLSTDRIKLVSSTFIRQFKSYLIGKDSLSSQYIVGIEWAGDFFDHHGKIFSTIFDDSTSPLYPFFVFQYPSQLPKSCRETLLNSTSTNITFQLGDTLLKSHYKNINRTGAEPLSELFDVGGSVIPNLGIGHYLMKNFNEDALYGYSFAPLPSKRSTQNMKLELGSNYDIIY